MQPRIYTYKITFEEVPYYYYGSKKEKRYDEYYMGSPKTNKWCWKLYTPKKQILELFNYTDDGYEECRKVEDRLIKPVLNDPWCLNERCNNLYSLKVLSDAGKKGGNKNKENKTGFCGRSKEKIKEDAIKGGKNCGNQNKELKRGYCGLSKEERSQYGKIGGSISKELGLGIFALTSEQRSENAKKFGKLYGHLGGEKCKELMLGIYSLSEEQRSENGKKGAQKAKELGVGIFALTNEELKENYNKGLEKLTKEQRSENSRKGAYQKWQCLETGFITNAGNLTQYQKARNIDTSKRVRVS